MLCTAACYAYAYVYAYFCDAREYFLIENGVIFKLSSFDFLVEKIERMFIEITLIS
jgi:hypothetical protein